jgi:hypothetical protein
VTAFNAEANQGQDFQTFINKYGLNAIIDEYNTKVAQTTAQIEQAI